MEENNNWWRGFISEINEENFFVELTKPGTEIKYIAEFPISLFQKMTENDQKEFELGRIVDVHINSGKINFPHFKPLTEEDKKKHLKEQIFGIKILNGNRVFGNYLLS